MIDTIEARGVATREPAFVLGPMPDLKSAIMAGTNGTDCFFRIKAGTPLGKITASGKYRPCGKTRVNGAVTGVSAVVVNEHGCFKDGDTVGILSKLGVKGAVTIDADGSATADLDIESIEADGLAHAIVLVDPGAASDLQGASVIDAVTGVETVTITLASSAVPAITSTVAEVLGEINATAQKIRAYEGATYTGSNTAAAVASTPLAGAIAVGGTVVTGRTLTKSTTTFTLSGAVFSAADDDLVVLEDGSQTAVGLLAYSVDCAAGVDYVNEEVLDIDPGCLVLDHGTVDESACPSSTVNADIKSDLANINWR